MTFKSINEVCVKWQKDLDNAILGEIKQKAIEHGIKTEYVLNEKAIINALEKQIPKKVVMQEIKGDIELRYCPCCNVRFIGWGMKYCGECGQALDWSDTE